MTINSPTWRRTKAWAITSQSTKTPSINKTMVALNSNNNIRKRLKTKNLHIINNKTIPIAMLQMILMLPSRGTLRASLKLKQILCTISTWRDKETVSPKYTRISLSQQWLHNLQLVSRAGNLTKTIFKNSMEWKGTTSESRT